MVKLEQDINQVLSQTHDCRLLRHGSRYHGVNTVYVTTDCEGSISRSTAGEIVLAAPGSKALEGCLIVCMSHISATNTTSSSLVISVSQSRAPTGSRLPQLRSFLLGTPAKRLLTTSTGRKVRSSNSLSHRRHCYAERLPSSVATR
jgi:hypothetical protein